MADTRIVAELVAVDIELAVLLVYSRLLVALLPTCWAWLLVVLRPMRQKMVADADYMVFVVTVVDFVEDNFRWNDDNLVRLHQLPEHRPYWLALEYF